jgi:RNA binding exosome subunit
VTHLFVKQDKQDLYDGQLKMTSQDLLESQG